MSLTTRTLPQIFNGISRQPPILRSPDQTEDELNTWSTESAGLGKRPPTQHVAKLMAAVPSTAFIHVINRDVTERYVVVIASGVLKVFDSEGVEKTVNAPGGLSYLSTGEFRAVTVADYTFIVNRSKPVDMKVVGADAVPPPEYLRSVTRQPTYRAGEFVEELFLPGDIGAYEPNPTSAAPVTGRVASIEKLPETAPDGTVYEIQGSSESLTSSFYVVRNGAVWDETVAPGLRNQIDEATMPHALIREADGSFTFAPFSWAPRRVGSEATNPLPTFVGRTINGVFFYQNRLAFLVDENVILSCAGDFGNFFRSTVIDVIDSDVVDVATTSSKVSILEHAVLFNDGALLFADQTQFALANGDNGVTPASMSVLPVTNYAVNKAAAPVVLGSEVYFAGEAAGSSVVYEYVRLPDNDSTSAAEVTAHVPGLIPAGIKQLVAPTRTLLALMGDKRVYVYQLYWDGNEKIVSAWRVWEMAGNVIAAGNVGDDVSLLVNHPDGLYLERLNLAEGSKPVNQPKEVHLDRQVELTGVYNAGTGLTTFTAPYVVPTVDRGSFQVIVGGTSPRSHSIVSTSKMAWTSETTFTVEGTFDAPVTFGRSYMCRFVFSQQFPRDFQGVPLTTGRLQMRNFTLRYSNTAYFETVVAPYGLTGVPAVDALRPKRVTVFSGKTVGSGTTILGKPTYGAGSFTFSVHGDSRKVQIAIENNTYMSSTFSSAEWEGLYQLRAR